MLAKKYIPIIFAVVVLAVVLAFGKPATKPENNGNPEPITAPATIAPTTHIIAGGAVGFSYPEEDMGLAVSEEQVLVRSYIPPCDQGFDYCIYYLGSAYTGTNFESAGVRINRRPDLASEAACLTPPYDNLKATIYRSPNYVSAAIGPLGNRAAGHYATGTLYRLFYEGGCYEFETRIGETQFLNYPRAR